MSEKTPTKVIKKKTNTPVVVKKQQIVHADNSVESFISQAIQQQLPIETIKEFLAMRKELKADQASEEYIKAMGKLQGELPTIKKLKSNGGTGSKYAPLEDIVAQSKKAISKNGFSYSWDTETTNGSITVTCKSTHVGGHIETSTMVSDMAEGTKVNSAPQKVAITITYLKRYTLCNLFGIVVADEDMDDRQKKQDTPALPLDPRAKVIALLRQLGVMDTSNPDETKEHIMKFTQLEVSPENIDEVVGRLSVLVEERNENN